MAVLDIPEPEFFQPIYLPKPKRERGPCPRNREIFAAVNVHHQSFRVTAEKFNLSVGRIHQIVTKVADWIGRTGGGPTRTWGERQRISEYLFREESKALSAEALRAWKEGEEKQTEKYFIEDEKVGKREITRVKTKRDIRYLREARAILRERQAFEDSRELPPEPEHMTVAERIREAGLIAADTVAAWKAEKEKEQAEKEQVAQVSDVPAEEAAAPVVTPPVAEEVVVATPVVVPPAAPEQPVENRADSREAPPSTGRLKTCPTGPAPGRLPSFESLKANPAEKKYYFFEGEFERPPEAPRNGYWLPPSKKRKRPPENDPGNAAGA